MGAVARPVPPRAPILEFRVSLPADRSISDSSYLLTYVEPIPHVDIYIYVSFR
jgi:hypothetical protein